MLSPAYDLLCTALHINDNDLALSEGLFPGDVNEPSFDSYGYYAYDDFYHFGLKVGLLPKRIKAILQKMVSKQAEITALVNKSYLSGELKEKYLRCLAEKQQRLCLSYTGLI